MIYYGIHSSETSTAAISYFYLNRLFRVIQTALNPLQFDSIEWLFQVIHFL